MTTNQQKAYFLAFGAIFLWATVATAFKIALSELHFATVLFIANFTAILITLFAIVAGGKIKFLVKTNLQGLLKSALLAVINPFGYYLVLFKAYSLLPAQIAQPLNFIWPLVLVLLSAPLLHQKLHFRSILALLISFSGVIIISTQGNLKELHITNSLGVILAASASILWALYWILNKKDTRDDIVKLFLTFCFSGIYMLISFLFVFNLKIEINKAFAAAVYIGFFEMGVTFIVWLKAIQLSERTDKISNLIYLTPVLSLFFIHFVLGEAIFYTTYIGLALILTGIFILNMRITRSQ